MTGKISLNKFSEREGCYQQYLAEKIFFDKSSITRFIDSLEKDRMVERKPDALDWKAQIHICDPKRKIYRIKSYENGKRYYKRSA